MRSGSACVEEKGSLIAPDASKESGNNSNALIVSGGEAPVISLTLRRGDESLDRPVVRSLDICREETCGQFIHASVISHALAAIALSAAARIGAITPVKVFLVILAFHPT